VLTAASSPHRPRRVWCSRDQFGRFGVHWGRVAHIGVIRGHPGDSRLSQQLIIGQGRPLSGTPAVMYDADVPHGGFREITFTAIRAAIPDARLR